MVVKRESTGPYRRSGKAKKDMDNQASSSSTLSFT